MEGPTIAGSAGVVKVFGDRSWSTWRSAQILAQPSASSQLTEQSAAPPQLTLQLPVQSTILQVVAPVQERLHPLPAQLSSQAPVLVQERSQPPPAQLCSQAPPPTQAMSQLAPAQVWVQSSESVHWRSQAPPSQFWAQAAAWVHWRSQLGVAASQVCSQLSPSQGQGETSQATAKLDGGEGGEGAAALRVREGGRHRGPLLAGAREEGTRRRCAPDLAGGGGAVGRGGRGEGRLGAMHPWHDIAVDAATREAAFPTVSEVPRGAQNTCELV